MKRALNIPRFRQRILVKPQNLQLADAGGRIALDFVGHYERLQASYDEICKRIGIPSAELPTRNASEHAAFTDYYDDELRTIVAEYYEADLRFFDYDFPSS